MKTAMKPEAVAAYEAMKAAEAVFRAERTEEAQAAYRAANAAYNALNPPKLRGWGSRAGRRQHAEQAALTAAAMARRFR